MSEEPAWCDTCHAHIIPMSRWERSVSRVCYWLAMHWPHWLAFTKPHYAILPWAGNYAYRCFCMTERVG